MQKKIDDIKRDIVISLVVMIGLASLGVWFIYEIILQVIEVL